MCDSNTYNDCIKIIEDKKMLTHKELEYKWATFKTKFPTFYKMLTTTNNIDLNLIEYMCQSALQQNDLSKNEQIEKEFDVGDRLAKKYIYDKFPEPNNQQKTFIKETLRKKINNQTPINPEVYSVKGSEDKSEEKLTK
jgi:hypothetical protein